MGYHSGRESDLGSDVKAELLGAFADEYSPFVRMAKALVAQLGPVDGVAAFEVALAELGGQKPHVPMAANFWHGLSREVRNEQIRARFDGRNLVELALEFDMGERYLRDIVAGGPKRYTAKTEPRHAVKISDAHHAACMAEAERWQATERQVVDLALRFALDSPEFEAVLKARFRAEVVPLFGSAAFRTTDNAESRTIA